MMQFSRMTLGKKARELGFVRDTFEKVCRLADVLDFVQWDALLFNALALKGETAINLTIFNLPRLSVDVDMDFSENVPRKEMLAIRKQITERISKYMTAAINYIRDHFSEQLTLEQVAQELNISRSYLALIFKKETSLTFSTWLRKYRIGKAKELLKNTNMSQDDICTEVGIYDSSYLCRLFKEYEHLSPDEYRKNWRTVCL